MGWFTQLAAGLDDLAELAAPRACGGCGCAHRRWCGGCAQWLAQALAGPALGWLDRPVPGFPDCWSGLAYDGPLVRALPAYKDDGRVDLAVPLALALRHALAGVHEQDADLQQARRAGRLTVVCVPSSPESVRVRGRLPLVDLTRRAVVGSGLSPAPPGTLRFVRAVHDQAGLSASDRAVNLRGAMRARPVGGGTVLVVDDIVTSGATLAEAARALHLAGARQVVAVTIAGAVLRRSDPLGGHRSGGPGSSPTFGSSH